MKDYFAILLLLFFTLANESIILAKPNPILQPIIKENLIYQPGNTLYVWAANGLNLRQKPSDKSKVILTLSYGTMVKVLKQDQPLVLYDYCYYSIKNTSETFTQISDIQPEIILKGYWLKINADGQEGYVFNKLLLPFLPKKMNEDFTEYMIRAFELNQIKKIHKIETLKDQNEVYTFPVDYTIYSSAKNNVLFQAKKNGGTMATLGYGGEITFFDLSFDQALVLLNIILPPLKDHGFTYKAGSQFEYLLDYIGNTAKLTLTKNTIKVEWFYGCN